MRCVPPTVMVLGCCLAILGSNGAPLRAGQTIPPVFRSAVGGVRVDVSVRRRGRPVASLALEDFEIRDNGVVQKPTDLSYEKTPIDLTVAFDLSLSVTGAVLNQLRRAVDEVRGRLRSGDRLKLITFNMRIQRVLDVTDQIPDLRTIFSRVTPAGSTALLDAVAVSLTSAAPIERRQLIIAFSDGQDTSSVTDERGLLDVARHTTGIVAFVLPGVTFARPMGSPGTSEMRAPGPPVTGFVGTLSMPGAVAPPVFRDVASETGGIILSTNGVDLAASFTRVLDELRSVYVLHYSPHGVAEHGFHELQVRITRRGDYDVRARRGYVSQ